MLKVFINKKRRNMYTINILEYDKDGDYSDTEVFAIVPKANVIATAQEAWATMQACWANLVYKLEITNGGKTIFKATYASGGQELEIAEIEGAL